MVHLCCSPQQWLRCWFLAVVVCLSTPVTSSETSGFTMVAHPNAALQAQLNPWRYDPTKPSQWTGADVDVSRKIGGPYALWVYGDTLIGHWNMSQHQRVSDFHGMPHSSIGLWNEQTKNMTWLWGKNKTSFFRPVWETSRKAFWPLGMSTMDFKRDKIYVIGCRVQFQGSGSFGFITNGTFVVEVTGVTSRPSKPFTWTQTWHFIPFTGILTGGFEFGFTSLVVDTLKSPGDLPTEVYLFGSTKPKGWFQRQVLARMQWVDFIAQDWTKMKFFMGQGKQWASWTPGLPMQLPAVWSTALSSVTMGYSKVAQRYFVLSLPFESTQLSVLTAPSISGPWSQPTPLLTLPAPWNATKTLFCYAVTLHESLSPSTSASRPRPSQAVPESFPHSDTSETFVFSYICNTFHVDTLFQPGRASAYVPVVNTLTVSSS